MASEYAGQAQGNALVPEHSASLMAALSGGEPFYIDNYMFVGAGQWLAAIAYPLAGRYSHSAFENALRLAVRRFSARQCWAIGPELPPALHASITERDRYYVLPAGAPVPSRLRGPLKRLAQRLTITEGSVFTPEHRRLWAEFLGGPRRKGGAPMSAHVAELYARAPAALAKAGGSLRLLDARDENGRLAACLLLDYGPNNFLSYVLGAHSRQHYTPHATDLLFAEMLARAQKSGKRFVNLGLGVNEGIVRFKKKWGAVEQLPFVMAAWDEGENSATNGMGQAIAQALLAPAHGQREIMAAQPDQKPLAMIWELEKAGRKSWIAGTAHFFCHSFGDSLTRLFRNVDHVLFEGPLDENFMAQVDNAGRPGPGHLAPLAAMMDEDEIRRLEKMVWGSRGPFWRFLGMEHDRQVDVRWHLENARPWCAFFTLWTAFLERKGWRNSVDMEAWRIAGEMGKNVVPSLDEQLDSLNSLPPERVVNFFLACKSWPAYARRNRRSYLSGDLQGMMGSSAEFPTRTEYVVSRRDQRFFERMSPYIEDGRCAVFVGAAHMLNLRGMLADAGWQVRQKPLGFWPSLKARLRREKL